MSSVLGHSHPDVVATVNESMATLDHLYSGMLSVPVVEVTAACLKRGLHMNIVQLPGMGGIFRIAPPLTIAESELQKGLDILDDALGSVLAQ